MGINLGGRVPKVKTVISPRVVWIVAGLFVILVVAIGFGFKKRFEKKREMKEQQAASTVSSGSMLTSQSHLPGEVPISDLSSPAPAALGEGQQNPLSQAAQQGGRAVMGAAATVANPTGNGGNALPAAWQQTPFSMSPLPSTANLVGPRYSQAQLDELNRRDREGGESDSGELNAPQQPTGTAKSDSTDSLSGFEQAQKLKDLKAQADASQAPTGVWEQAPVKTNATAQSARVAGGDDIQKAQRFMSDSATQAGAPSEQGALSTVGSVPGHDAPEEAAGAYQAQNQQGMKRKFAGDSSVPEDDYLRTSREPSESAWVIQRGTNIPATLAEQINTDLPGDFQAIIQHDVYETIEHRYIEIPAGSRAIGEYNSAISYGQGRAQVAWTAICFPDGSHIDLGRMPGHSADGTTGLHDKVDNHYRRLIGGIVLTSILSAGLQLSQNRTGSNSVYGYPSSGQVIASSVGTSASETATELTQRNANIQPTIVIRPGALVNIRVNKDIVFPGPYQPMKPVMR